MKKQTKTNHSQQIDVEGKLMIPPAQKTSSNVNSVTADTNIQEEKKMHENYGKFQIFWEKARDIQDEDGDNILKWDKSNIANFCFIAGLEQGDKEGYNKCLAEVEKMIWKYPNEFITEAETKDEAESIKSELKQKLKEMRKC